jgi:hypothetical protein
MEGMVMTDDEDDEFDARDLIELVALAGYLESKAKRGLFPKARSNRYSATLDRLIALLADLNHADLDDDPDDSVPVKKAGDVVKFRPRR